MKGLFEAWGQNDRFFDCDQLLECLIKGNEEAGTNLLRGCIEAGDFSNIGCTLGAAEQLHDVSHAIAHKLVDWLILRMKNWDVVIKEIDDEQNLDGLDV